MPMRITDSRLRTMADALRRESTPKITDANVIDLLAAVGDGSNMLFAQAKAALTRPGITRQEQFELAKKGLSNSEKSDLVKFLDESGFQMDAGAKNFLEALVGRAPLQGATFGPLTIVGDQKHGIAGVAKPGATVEAINLSAAPAGRLHLADTMVIGTADASGKFLGQLPDVREGDLIRMRTRAADGSTSDWLTIQAKGVEARDTRNAIVNLERMDLVAVADGVTVTHNTGRPLCEPGATLRFTNARTGEKVDVKVTDLGSLPKGLKLPGRAGDEFRIAASDGVNNTTFATVAGTLSVPGASTSTTGGVDLPDPKMHKDELNADGTPRYKLERFTGPLFVNGAKPDDVRQGAIGNCYFPAAMAAVAAMKPEAIENMIKANGDGTYTVRFNSANSYSGGRPVEIKVDGDLYARAFGGPIYGNSLGGPTTKDQMELWFPLIEKAYAQWKGSYDTIGNGGSAGQVMAEVLGRPSAYDYITPARADRIFDRITKAAEQKKPMAAGTYGHDEDAKYTNTGVYANHAYSVLGTEQENGVKYVKVRNPWGQSEHGHDGKNDGFFRIELSKFVELYQSLHVVD